MGLYMLLVGRDSGIGGAFRRLCSAEHPLEPVNYSGMDAPLVLAIVLQNGMITYELR